MLELYHWHHSAESARVLIALREKGLEVSTQSVDVLRFEQFTTAFLALNPAGQVPVLVHDEHILTDSALILLYLEEAFPEPALAPHDGKGWYEVLCWSKTLESGLGSAVSTVGWHRVMAPKVQGWNRDELHAAIEAISVPERKAAWYAATAGYSQEAVDDSLRKIALAVQRVETTLASGNWLLGDCYSLVDIDAYVLVDLLPALTPELVNAAVTPHIMDWLERIRARDAVCAVNRLRNTENPLFAPGPEHSRWG